MHAIITVWIVCIAGVSAWMKLTVTFVLTIPLTSRVITKPHHNTSAIPWAINIVSNNHSAIGFRAVGIMAA